MKSSNTQMKSDETLQRDILEELAFDPEVTPSHIGVTVENGVVTLRGPVSNYAEKLAAEKAAKRVSGVHAFTDELQVEIPSLHHRDDRDIAKSVLDALYWDVTVPEELIQAKVDNAWVTLEGEVDWQYQVDNAKRAVQFLTGVRGVTSLVTLKHRIAAQDIKAKLAETFKRSAEIDANQIQIEIDDDQVTLRGTVHSWIEHDDAARAAYSLPGVKRVENLTHVG
jgi:osmotically-inducible protein OsmY